MATDRPTPLRLPAASPHGALSLCFNGHGTANTSATKLLPAPTPLNGNVSMATERPTPLRRIVRDFQRGARVFAQPPAILTNFIPSTAFPIRQFLRPTRFAHGSCRVAQPPPF